MHIQPYAYFYSYVILYIFPGPTKIFYDDGARAHYHSGPHGHTAPMFSLCNNSSNNVQLVAQITPDQTYI